MIVAGKLKVVVMEPWGWLQIAPRDCSPPVPGSGQRHGGAGGVWEPVGMRGAGSAGCNAELEAPKLCILCIVQCWVAIFLIFFLSGCWTPKMLIWDLKKHPVRLPSPFARAVSMPNTCIFVFQTGDPSSSFKPR